MTFKTLSVLLLLAQSPFSQAQNPSNDLPTDNLKLQLECTYDVPRQDPHRFKVEVVDGKAQIPEFRFQSTVKPEVTLDFEALVYNMQYTEIPETGNQVRGRIWIHNRETKNEAYVYCLTRFCHMRTLVRIDGVQVGAKCKVSRLKN